MPRADPSDRRRAAAKRRGAEFPRTLAYGADMPCSGASTRELAGATLSLLLLYATLAAPLLWRGGLAPGLPAASVFLAAVLAASSAIDLYFHRLPDLLTLPLAVVGLFVSLATDAVPLWWPVVSAGAGFFLLAGIAYAYQYVRGRAGLGLGDAKLMAASGAWLGAGALPTVLLWATGSALVCVLIASRRNASLTGASRLPFGPFLAFGTWLVWLYGPL